MNAPIPFTTVGANSKAFISTACALAMLVLTGLWAAHTMDTHGHHITGMNNRIVWGMPHVCAIVLILSASGALNAATLASVFGKTEYYRWARLSAVMATTLLLGGLGILVLDLGRPDRLIVALTHYNPKSIFAWNVALYTGFIAIAVVYLWLLMERRWSRLTRPAGVVAFAWRLILTTGTGSIFGFLVARGAYDTAVMAPLFLAMSFAFGTALFLFAATSLMLLGKLAADHALLRDQARLLSIFIGLVGYFIIVFHLTNGYIAQRGDAVSLMLIDGKPYAALFWLGQVLLGGVIPLVIFNSRLNTSIGAMAAGSLLVVGGGAAHLYVIIIGGQALPLAMFPGAEVASSFHDGGIADYTPSLYESLLGIGGLAFAALALCVVMRVLPVVPDRHGPASATSEIG